MRWWRRRAPLPLSSRRSKPASIKLLHDSEVQKRLTDLSAEPVGGTTQETANYLKQESERWKHVITAAHVTLD
jgi:tripartite-type tricarboxylate transporter receptor subunit TctC